MGYINDQHTSLKYSSDVQEICKPLEECLNIKCFVFVRIYNNGKRICLTNARQWQQHYCISEHYLIDNFALLPNNYTSNFYTWNLFPNSAVFIDARANFNIEYMLTIVDKQIEHCDIYHFGKEPTHSLLNYNLCVSNLEIFYEFIEYFKEKAKKLITTSDVFNFVETIDTEIVKTDAYTDEFYKKKEKLSTYIKPKRYYLDTNNNNTYLTQKEFECVKWLLIGKSLEEVGLILNMPKRTVETHINNIKNKLNCNKITQILYYLSKSSLSHLLI